MIHVLGRRVLAALFAVVPTAGLAGPPYITDDTGTQGRGNWQLELIGDYIHHDKSAISEGMPVNQQRRVTVFGPVLTYGVVDTVDIAVGVSRLRDRITENGTLVQDVEGTGDLAVEAKWRFYESKDLSFAVKAGLLLPTGDETRGLGTGKASGVLNAIVTYTAGPWTWLANLAHEHLRFKRPEDAQGSHRHVWRLSGGFGYRLSETLNLAAEAGVRTNPARDDPFLPGNNGHFVMLGIIYSPAENVDIAFGFRKSTNDGESDRAFPFGVTFRW